MPRKTAVLTKSMFYNSPRDQPFEAEADASGITLRSENGDMRLTPRHIEAIVAMQKDWWTEHWGPLFESE